MDEMRVSTKFMQNIVSKILRKVIGKKLGCDPAITFNSPIEFKFDEENAQIHVDITASMTKEDISKLLKDFI